MKPLLFALFLTVMSAPFAHAQLVVNGEVRDGGLNAISMPDVESYAPDANVNFQQDENGFLTVPVGASDQAAAAQSGQTEQPKTGEKKVANNPAQQIYRGDVKQKLEPPRTHRMYEPNNFN